MLLLLSYLGYLLYDTVVRSSIGAVFVRLFLTAILNFSSSSFSRLTVASCARGRCILVVQLALMETRGVDQTLVRVDLFLQLVVLTCSELL